MAESLGSGAPARPDGSARTRSIGKVEVHPILHNKGPETTRDVRRGREREIQRDPNKERLEKSREGLKQFLVGELNKLVEEHRIRGDAGFNEFIRDADKMSYLDLFRQLTTDKGHEGAKRDMLHVDKDAVDALMANDRGLARVYDVLRREYADDLQEEGLKGRIRRNAPRPGAMDKRSITLTQGAWATEGGRALLDFFAKPIGGYAAEGRGNPGGFAQIFTDKLGKVVLTVGGSSVVLGTAAALTVGTAGIGPLALVVGATAAPEVVAGIVASFRQGATYRKDVAPEVLHRIKRDAAKVTWAKRMHGKDPNDFIVRNRWWGRNDVVVDERRSARTVLPKETRRERSDSLMNLIRDYQIAHGIPPKYVEPMDVGWILRGLRNPPQHGDLDLTPRIMEIVDATPRPPRYGPGVGFIEGNTSYNVDLFRRVQERLLRQELDFVFREIMHGKKDYVDDSRAEIQARQNILRSGPEAQRRREALEQDRDRLTADRATLTEGAGRLRAYPDRIRAARTTLEELERRRLAAEGRGEIRTGITLPGGGAGPTGTIDIATLADVQGTDGSSAVLQIDGETITGLIRQRTTLNGEIDRALDTRYPTVRGDRTAAEAAVVAARASLNAAQAANTGSDRAERAVTTAQQQLTAAESGLQQARDTYEQNRQEVIDLQFSGRVATLDRHEQLVAELLRELNEVQTQTRLTQRELANPVAADRRAMTDTLSALERARTRVEGWTVPANPGAIPPIAGIDLGTQALRTQNFEELRDRIVATGRLTADDMREPENRRMLLQAMAEARAVGVIDLPLARLPDVTNPAIFGITEARLLNPAITDGTIAADIAARAAAIGAGAPAVLSAAEVGELRRALQTTRDLEFVSNPANSGLTYSDILAFTPQEITERLMANVRLADVTNPTIFNISEAVLLNPARTDANIAAEIESERNLLITAGGTPPPALSAAEVGRLRQALELRNRNNLGEVRTEATRRLTARQRALDQLGTNIQATIDQREASLTEIANGIPTHELDVIAFITKAENYNRINEDIRNRPLYTQGENGRRNTNSLEAFLAGGQVTDAMTALGVPGAERFLPAEVGMDIAYARILQELIPPPPGGIPESFVYNGVRGEAGWILRNREMITPDMLMAALRDRFTLGINAPLIDPATGLYVVGAPPINRPVATFNEARYSLRYNMGLEFMPSPPAPANTRPPITITPDDFGSFLSEDIFNMMRERIRTADSFALTP